MPSTADRIDLGPPRDTGAISSFGLALLVHAALIAALTWGVTWKRSDRSVAFEAYLLSDTPQESAPKLVEATPPPPPPPPEPAQKVQEVKPPEPNVDMALEQEKKRKLQAKQAQQGRSEKELKLKQEQAKRKAAEEAKRLEAKKQQQQNQANAAALEAQRKKNIARAMGLADASGAENAKGTAQKSAGPSASYAGMVRARVKPNIVFTEDIAGNPSAEVEVRTALDGTIMSQRLVKTSGNKAWDDAVVKAIIRTEKMPRDTDGRVPTPMILEFRPKD